MIMTLATKGQRMMTLFISPSSTPPAALRRGRRISAQRGMTLLEIMIVLAILGLIIAVVVPKVMGRFAEAKGQTTLMAVKKYVDEAYPQWAASNPTKSCPASLADLGEAASTNKEAKDPWGNPYKMFCGSNMPAGVKRFAVMSLGEDGKEGTDDDIKSWE
jgi:general secretion pathway protein G